LEQALEVLYHTSTVPYGPDGEQIKRHLLHCLEMHDGDRSAAVVQPDEAVATLRKLAELTRKYRRAPAPRDILSVICAVKCGGPRRRSPAVRTDLCIPGIGMSDLRLIVADALLLPIREDS
jgi:hypothetical protein